MIAYQIEIDKTVNGISEHIKQGIEWFWGFAPNLVSALLILLVGLWAIGLANTGLKRFFDKKDYDVTLELFILNLVKYSLRVLLIILIITQLGVKTSSLIAVLGAAGLAIGLALQGSLSNFAGGILLLIFKPMKVGDWISAQGIDGEVQEIGIFNTKIKTFGNQVASIPNGALSNGSIVNYDSLERRRDNITIGISYSSDIEQARRIILDLCAADERIDKDPAPQVLLSELADSSVNLAVRFWAHNSVFWPAHFELIENMKNAFDKNGIEIPFPQRVVHRIGDATD